MDDNMNIYIGYTKNFFLVAIALLIFNSTSALADEAECIKNAAGGLAVAQCYAAQLNESNKKLEALYQAQLKIMPISDSFDLRKTAAQLEKAQKTWETSRDEGCTFWGGQKGGGNIWITAFTTECLVEETEHRIIFFEQVLTFTH